MLQVLNCDEDTIEHLMHCCLWSKDSLIQHYLDHPVSLRKEAGLTGDPAIPPPIEGAELMCPVCLLSAPASDMLWLWCNHACCKVGVAKIRVTLGQMSSPLTSPVLLEVPPP